MVKVLSSNIKCITLLLVGAVLGAFATDYYYNILTNRIEESTVVNQKLYTVNQSINYLHLLEIKNETSLIDLLTSKVIDDIKLLNQIYLSGNITITQKAQVEGIFRLLFVFNEKYDYQKWRKNKLFLDILNKSTKTNYENIKWLRCQNWNKPMWIGKSKCK